MLSCDDPIESTTLTEDFSDTISLYSYFPNGRLAQKCTALPDSIFHGVCQYFYKEGGVKTLAGYNRGIRHGIWKTFHQNGSLESKHHYSNGILNGPFQWYYASSALKLEGSFINDQYNGWINHYYESGELRLQSYYRERNRHLKDVAYYENGVLNEFAYYLQGEQVGFKVRFDRKGAIQKTFGDIIVDIEIDQTQLFWKDALEMEVTAAIPPGWLGQLNIQQQTDGENKNTQAALAAPQYAYKYIAKMSPEQTCKLTLVAKIYLPSDKSVTLSDRKIVVVDAANDQIYFPDS